MPAESRKRFSMIREFHFADWFTLGNAVCGTGALFSSMTYLQTGSLERIYVACSLIFTGLIFDILDGRIARMTNTTSAFGINDWEWILAFEADELDRLVDCIRRLRDAKARRFTKVEVPFVTGIRKDVRAAFADLT